MWVPIDMVVPHPRNPNKMTPEQMAKLDASIGDYDYPPIICRSLELSTEFQDLHAAGKVQSIDGAHRLLREQNRGSDMVEIRVWGGVSDHRALLLLRALNRLHGEDDKAKVATIMRDLYDTEGDYDALAAVLPEDAEQIRSIVEEVTREAVKDASARASQIADRSPMTIFVTPAQEEIIRSALKRAMDTLDREHQTVVCEEGEALATICRAYQA